MSIHHLDLIVEDGVPHIKFRCTGMPDADCRRRPPDWEESGDESWSLESATETGFECWAADWIDATGFGDAVMGENGTYASAPIDISYDEGVIIAPATAQEPIFHDPADVDGRDQS